MVELQKGGIYTEPYVDLHQVIAKPLLEIVGEYFKKAVLEREYHKQTLNLLAQIVEGEIDPSTLIVNPDGWQIKGERPIDDSEEYLARVPGEVLNKAADDLLNQLTEVENGSGSKELEHLSASS